MTGSERFGANLREWRQRRKLTQEQLGEKVGADGPRIGRLEKGAENPTLETLDRLGDALVIDVSEFHRPRPEGAGHEKVGGVAGAGTRLGVDPLIAGLLDALDQETTAPDSIEGDILKASAVLDRALRRLATARASGE